MDKEDDKLRQQVGRENPFRVPEGYFEGFVSSLSTRLPNENKAATLSHPRRQLKFIDVAVACVCAAVFSISVYFVKGGKQATTASVQTDLQSANGAVYNDIDRAADYTMLDNEDIYAYILSDLDNE